MIKSVSDNYRKGQDEDEKEKSKSIRLGNSDEFCWPPDYTLQPVQRNTSDLPKREPFESTAVK